MNREQILDSAVLKQHFCMSHDVPINIFEEPYFTDRLNTISLIEDRTYDFDTYCEDLSIYKDEKEYFKHYRCLREKILHSIKSTDGYIRFERHHSDFHMEYPDRDIYTSDNDNKTFISISMKQPDYQALNHYCPSIFGISNTWEDFVEQYTDILYLKYSKVFREEIFLECNPKEQILYTKGLMNKLANHIKNELETAKIYSVSFNKVLLSVEGSAGFSFNTLEEVVSACPEGIGNLVTANVFDIHKLKNTGGYVYYIFKEKNTPHFQGVDYDVLPQLIKYYYNIPIKKSDLVISYNGRLAAYLKPIENPWR